MSATKRQKTTAQNDIPSHLISVKDVSSNYLNYLLKEAEDMKVMVIKNGGDERLKHRVLASVFYEVR
jgi:aspartate carbamoyltransferase catalytic subunit